LREPKVSFRILHRCDFHCPSCSTFSGPERRGIMSAADFDRAMEILAAEGFGGQLNISGGETTLHPDLGAMLASAASRLPASASICVFTNGHWVGGSGWRELLAAMSAGPNVLVRFSLDRWHAVGQVRVGGGEPSDDRVRAAEHERITKAGMFLKACREMGREPGTQFDIAFKGTLEEGRAYTQDLGDVPLYLIRFRSRPARRPKECGFLAVDVTEDDEVLVYPTLGHIPTSEPAGGLETLADVLARNRRALDE
jgi:Radical SAM superfamily